MDSLIQIFSQLLSPYGLLIISSGVAVGIFGGALPGISSTMTVALVATLTYSMDPLWAIMFLAATQVGSTYGGSISAVVLNIPGTPASAPTAIEGYQLAKKGEAEKALSINVVSSFAGNTVGVILLLLVMPVMLRLAMLFGPWEMFWFAMFGLMICAKLSRAHFLKGLLAACFGLLLSLVGVDPIWGVPRFTYGSTYLMDGIGLVPAMVGLFGMSEVFSSLKDCKYGQINLKGASLFQFAAWAKFKWMSLRASVLGFIIGVVPGVGANIACWIGYDHALSFSREKEKFGHGTIEGLVGSESANNACVPGAYAPLLVLGVPGDSVTAVVLGILTIHGVQVGPNFLRNNPEFLYELAGALFMSGVLFLLIGTIIGRGIVKVLTAPLPAIMAVVIVLCVIGAYSVNLQILDVYVMFFFGILGLIMRELKFPTAPLILGIVLGGELADGNFRRALMAGKGSFEPFLTRPISSVMVALLLIILFMEFIWPLIQTYWRKRKEADPTR
jgi:putative tricarboxylic transport membrane protein